MPNPCGRSIHPLHTRKTARVDVWSGLASTRSLEAAESLRVDVWTVWTP